MVLKAELWTHPWSRGVVFAYIQTTETIELKIWNLNSNLTFLKCSCIKNKGAICVKGKKLGNFEQGLCLTPLLFLQSLFSLVTQLLIFGPRPTALRLTSGSAWDHSWWETWAILSEIEPGLAEHERSTLTPCYLSGFNIQFRIILHD